MNITKSKIFRFISPTIENHITKSRLNQSLNVKALIISAALLDLYGNTVDSIKISKNNKIPEEQRRYLLCYKIINGVFSALLEVFGGFVVLDKRIQSKISDILFKNIKITNPALFIKCSNGLKAFSSIVIATVIIKRLIAPIFVTPTANLLKNKFFKAKRLTCQS